MQREYVSYTPAECDSCICFEIHGETIGNAYACVNAIDEKAARARMAPLFPGCSLTPVDSYDMVAVHV